MFALTLSGEKVRAPLGPPTWTTWVATIPSAAALAMPVDAAAALVARVSEAATPVDAPISPACVVAAPSPARADTMNDLEKYILLCFGDEVVKE
jgi:hypothetical protein